MTEKFQIIPVKVEKCPQCGQPHEYLLKASVEEAKIPLFAGPGGKTEIGLDCPILQSTFFWKADDPKDGVILGLATPEDLKNHNSNKTATPKATAEFEDWVKQSRDKALSFCSTMLTTSTGAIGIYFTIQKFLGLEKIEQADVKWLTIVPPILYLLSALVFVRALQPTLILVAASEFDNYKKDRLSKLNSFIQLGALIFSIASLLAIILFFISI